MSFYMETYRRKSTCHCHQEIASCHEKYSYEQSNAHHTLFLKRKNDDMIVTSDDLEEIDKLKGYLVYEFDMKDRNGLKYFLGIEVTRSEHGIFLSQRKYVLDLLKEIGMLGCEPIGTPIEQNHGLEEYPDQVPIIRDDIRGWLVAGSYPLAC
ncbi:unnamed protein product [Prunus armeniaca]